MSNTKLCESCEDPNQSQHVIDVNDQTTTSSQQTMEIYLENNKKLYDIIYEYLDNSDENNEYENQTDYFHKITEIVNEQENFREEMEQFLQIETETKDVFTRRLLIQKVELNKLTKIHNFANEYQIDP